MVVVVVAVAVAGAVSSQFCKLIAFCPLITFVFPRAVFLLDPKPLLRTCAQKPLSNARVALATGKPSKLVFWKHALSKKKWTKICGPPKAKQTTAKNVSSHWIQWFAAWKITLLRNSPPLKDDQKNSQWDEALWRPRRHFKHWNKLRGVNLLLALLQRLQGSLYVTCFYYGFPKCYGFKRNEGHTC